MRGEGPFPNKRISFEVKDHRDLKLYDHGNGLFPSVTEVLKIMANPGFEKYQRQNPMKMKNAAGFGTRVHAMAADIAMDRKTPLTDELEPFYIAIHAFFEQHVDRIKACEQELVSVKLKLGGTLDLYAVMKDGREAVIDYKTTSSLTREHGLQTAGYALLLRDNGYGVKRRICVRLKKEKPGAYVIREYEKHWDDTMCFLNCLKVWHWKHGATLAKRMKQKGYEL